MKPTLSNTISDRLGDYSGVNSLLAVGFLILLSFVFLSPARAQSRDERKKIEVFNLSDVRLLPGPFRHAQEMDERYLLELDPDRLLASYYKTAGLKPKAPQYGGWESTHLSGAILGHYLSAASMMFASTGNPKLKERVDYIVDRLKQCQETRFPDTQETSLRLKMDHNQKLTLEIRHPWWAGAGFSIEVNGRKLGDTGEPGSCFRVSREWHSGDKITVHLPMRLRVFPMANDSDKVAIMYGTIVLAGELGGHVPLPYAKDNSQFFDMPDVSVPSLAIEGKPVNEWLKPVAGHPLYFKTVGVGRPNDLELKPLYEISHQHYTVYWDIVRPD